MSAELNENAAIIFIGFVDKRVCSESSCFQPGTKSEGDFFNCLLLVHMDLLIYGN